MRADPLPRIPSREESAMRVLVLDDQPAVVKLVQRVVDHLGHEATTLGTAQAARDLARAEPSPFDLFLVDRNLDDDCDGAALASELRDALGNPRVILMSGEPGTPPGVDGLLEKPFGIAELRAAIEGSAGT
jgi:DNA-binding response OmpR family regulator